MEVDWEDYVCIVNDPRNEYYRTNSRFFERSCGSPVVYPNVPSDEIKDITQRSSLEDGVPAWMGCDV